MKMILQKFGVILGVVAILSACSVVPNVAQTPTPDVNAVKTMAASTAYVQLTDIAATNQAQPTNTSAPTPTITQEMPSMPLEQITATTDAQPMESGLSTPSPAAAAAAIPTATMAATMAGGISIIPQATQPVPCYASLFVTDVTIPDKTVLKPLQRFTKIWRIQNSGTCKWTKGFGLVYFNGAQLSGVPAYFSSNDPVILPGMQVDIPIHMIAPEKKGQYYSEWIMVDADGKSFGYPVYVMIEVRR